MSEVKFWVLINNHLEPVSGLLDDTLVDIFKDPSVKEHIPAKVTYRDCKFYRLKIPVHVRVEVQDDAESNVDDGDDEEIRIPDNVMQACLDESNRRSVNPLTDVCTLANKFYKNHAYLVIDFPDPLLKSEKAIWKLQQRHSVLFKCLQVTVEKPGTWSKEDRKRNLRGGTLTTTIATLPSEFEVINDALGKSRGYIQTNDETQSRDFQSACCYSTQFDLVFTPATGTPDSPAVVKEREFSAFYNILRCFYEDVEIITDDTSSALKAGNFTIHFIQPPFFSKTGDTRSFEYQQEKSWTFPIFVDTPEAPKAFRKFSPRSDWMVISRTHFIPFVISEVISDPGEKDRQRMLVQATALARAGRRLLKSNNDKFFVVAIYLDAKMIASRYIVMQHPPEDSGTPSEKVSIHQKDFDLKVVDEEVKFLREMYNLATRIDKLSKGLDKDKHSSLIDLKKDAGSVLSLNSTKHTTMPPAKENLKPIAEGGAHSDELEDEEDLGVFEAEDIQKVLRQMNYKIEFRPWGHPQLAVIVNKFDDKHGYLKFTDRENEVNVLRYLTGLESPLNHTITGVQFWPVQGGTVISMPVAGGWLTALENPNEQLWSVALQFFEAVAFMHQHNVAHMDIKPKNVIIPLKGGRLSIIDFSVSIIVDGPDVRHGGVVGTEGYIAPEIRKGRYKPMLADLWSCGRTMEELCACCDPSAERTKLLDVARLLMARDPKARPKMLEVLEYLSPKNHVAPPTLAVVPPVPKSSPCLA